eukprot:gnl/MRDRNA2_/MRDRNA2_90406_c0_seq1.p1 gnl/MRDRNA2_/MRDRNA2_90406_c0~~gnl/MRDRNA2_/MRDRNA2_90406_c0_seq1.p1  ORF type:complete len:151 (-),score=21.50 gnl/MRDRNA2_/MRDRNA2_90406_c0_seq1:97-549(-)
MRVALIFGLALHSVLGLQSRKYAWSAFGEDVVEKVNKAFQSRNTDELTDMLADESKVTTHLGPILGDYQYKDGKGVIQNRIEKGVIKNIKDLKITEEDENKIAGTTLVTGPLGINVPTKVVLSLDDNKKVAKIDVFSNIVEGVMKSMFGR